MSEHIAKKDACWIISSFLVSLLLMMGMGCTTKQAVVTLPAILNKDGTIKIPPQNIEYKETNFFSEDKSEGIWFEANPKDGILLEFNKSETTMDAALKLAEYIMSLAPRATAPIRPMIYEGGI